MSKGSPQASETRIVAVYSRDDGEAVLQPILIAPASESNWEKGVRLPIEGLDNDNRIQNGPYLSCLLPQAPLAHRTSISYVNPGGEIDSYLKRRGTDERSKSHILMVLLGLFAQGADQRLRTTAFKDRLALWSASTWPSKAGRLQSVGMLDAKLNILLDGYSTGGTESIDRLILSSSNQGTIREILSNPQMTRLKIDSEQVSWSGNTVTLHRVTKKGVRRLKIVFLESWDEALENVFGQALIKEYARQLSWDRVRLPLALVALLTLAAGVFIWGHFNQKIAFKIVADKGREPRSLVGLKPSGSQAFRVSFRHSIGAMIPVNVDGRGRDEVIIGLSHGQLDQSDEFLPGTVIAFNGFGRELWRSRVSDSRYHGLSHIATPFGVQWIEQVNRRGREPIVIAGYNSDTLFPCVVRGFSPGGVILFEFAHPGRLYNLHAFESGRVVFAGHLNLSRAVLEAKGVRIDDQRQYGSSLFAVDIETLMEQYQRNEAALTDKTGRAAEPPPAVWYYALSSTACDFLHDDELKPQIDGSMIAETDAGIMFQVQEDGSFTSFASASFEASHPELTLVKMRD